MNKEATVFHLKLFCCLLGGMAVFGCAGPQGLPVTTAEFAKAPAATPSPGGQSTADVRQVFEGYRNALLATDGKAAADFMDAPTLGWYQESIADALTLKWPDLEKRNMLRRFTVLRLRLEFSKKELASMTGRTLFSVAVERGWISKSSVETVELARIEFTSDVMGQASLRQAPDQFLFFFAKEENRWKFSLWKTFHFADNYFQAEVAKAGISERDYLLQLLKVLSANEVTDAILDGPVD